jgi:hypothetical protein
MAEAPGAGRDREAADAAAPAFGTEIEFELTDASGKRVRAVDLRGRCIEASDIFGDGVNIAARLEALAEPGGICLSAAAHEQVRDRLDLAFDDLGEQQVKNIARPVRTYRVALGASSRAALPPLSLPDKPSLAVLPFQNMTGDAEQEYGRCRAGVFRRRHGRGDHDGDRAAAVAFRHCPQLRLAAENNEVSCAVYISKRAAVAAIRVMPCAAVSELPLFIR